MASVRPKKDDSGLCERPRRQAIDLVAVIDTSGSMSGASLALVRRALRFVVQQLGTGAGGSGEAAGPASDRVAIVTFADNAKVALPLTGMDHDGKRVALQQVGAMTAEGGTNLSAGLFAALDLLGRRESKRPVTSVLLLTDGMANKGLLEQARLTKGVQQYLARDEAATSIFTFGVGDSHDPADLSAVSAASQGGVYSFLRDADGIAPCFARCLGGLLSVAAQNIRLSFDASRLALLSPGSRQGAAHDSAPEKSSSASLGDIYLDERKDVVFVLLRQPAAAECASPLVLHLDYFDGVALEPRREQHIADAAGPATVAEQLRVFSILNRAIAVRAMKLAARQGDSPQVRRALAEAESRIRASEAFAAGDKLSHALLEHLRAVGKLLASEAAAPGGGTAPRIALSLSSQYELERFVSEQDPSASKLVHNARRAAEPCEAAPAGRRSRASSACLSSSASGISFISFQDGHAQVGPLPNRKHLRQERVRTPLGAITAAARSSSCGSVGDGGHSRATEFGSAPFHFQSLGGAAWHEASAASFERPGATCAHWSSSSEDSVLERRTSGDSLSSTLDALIAATGPSGPSSEEPASLERGVGDAASEAANCRAQTGASRSKPAEPRPESGLVPSSCVSEAGAAETGVGASWFSRRRSRLGSLWAKWTTGASAAVASDGRASVR